MFLDSGHWSFTIPQTVLPAPPASGAPGWKAEGAANLQFSVLYALQQLTKHCQDLFGDSENLKDFRARWGESRSTVEFIAP